MAVRSKTFEYRASLGRGGVMLAEGADPVATPGGWTPDHLVLAALLRCSLGSLRHHVARAGIGMEGEGEAHGVVARREEDGRFAIVDVDVALDVRLDPLPSADDARELIRKAERDCFVAASLRARPRYRWTVNGVPLDEGVEEAA